MIRSDVGGLGVAGYVQREFGASLRTPAEAREYVRASLKRLLAEPVSDDLCDDAQLIVSELVTNAVRAGTEIVVLVLQVKDGRLRIEVGDDAGGVPTLRRRDPDAGSGRGLPLIEALATDWGVEARSAGKTVWAALRL